MAYVLSLKHARKSDSDFVIAAARAFYVDWYFSDLNPRKPNESKLSGCELTEEAPETQRWAFKLAREFATGLVGKLGPSLPVILEGWRKTWDEYAHKDRESSDENMGWYAAMEAMGHGAGLFDFGIEVDLPHIEAYPR
ncbi:hypothetical protein [Azospirillum sp. TSO5]|uniref:hypothetical protein n=1 Tax=Azospirillum sp. TSO5 TaxID=716760 RepID=UPI000D6180B8|nr:hypothetical protein [Azospirillum sp. TSO5]PWC98031.1 hypothetical protein TSO5_03230 [Azospirillum sp. TSO5]